MIDHPQPSSPEAPEARHNQIQVIARAAAVLHALEDEEHGLSLGRIASRVGLPRSTVQRIVAALETEQFVIHASASGGVRLGPALLRLAASVNTSALEIARPLVTALSSDLRETVDISVPKRDHLVFIDQVVGLQRLRTVSSVGQSFPLFCTANGKAFLATLSDVEIIKRIGHNYEARTPHTLISFSSLKADLVKTRTRGYSIDSEEHSVGVTAVGILVYDILRNPLMVSVPVPTARFEQMRDEIIRRILKSKAILQARFDEE